VGAIANKSSVTGEKLVSPGSIVQLAFKARYVYPNMLKRTPTSSTTKAISNGDALKAGSEEKDPAESVTEVENSVEPITKGENPMNGDIKEKIEEVKDIVLEKAEDTKEQISKDVEKVEKKVGRKGKGEAKIDWKSNGFAHTPNWPYVSPHHPIRFTYHNTDLPLIYLIF